MHSWVMAFRQLRRRPGFSLVAVGLLALGLTASTSVFALVYTVLLRPLPYAAPEQLTYVFEANLLSNDPTSLIAPGRLEDWRARNRAFTSLSGYYSDNKTDRSGRVPTRVKALMVAPGFFETFGVLAAFGRVFTSEEERAYPAGAAVVSWKYWQEHLGGRRNVIGKQLRLGDQAFSVVGVMPSSFSQYASDLFLPQAVSPGLMQAREARFLVGIGRLRPGVSVQQGKQDLERVQRDLGAVYPRTDAGWGAKVQNMQEAMTGDRAQSLRLAMGAVSLLLLLACLNVAGLLLAQVEQRRNEFAIRVALGASGGRLGRALMQETLLLAAAGWLIAACLSSWCVPLLGKVLINMPRINELTLDWRALTFGGFATLLSATLASLLPVRQAWWSGLGAAMSQGGRSTTDRHHRALGRLLLGQVALTVVLLSCAGLLLSTYQRLAHVDVGYQADHVLTFRIGAEWSEDRGALARLHREWISALQATPDVVQSGMTNFVPTDGATLRSQVSLEGLRSGNPDGTFTVGTRSVSGGYLAALRIRLVAGEACPTVPFSFEKGPYRALVNEAFVRQYGQGQNLLGRRIGRAGDLARPTIIGIISDVREDAPQFQAVPYVYDCFLAGGWPDPTYVVRTHGDAAAFRATLRRLMARIAPQRALSDVETLESRADDALRQPKLTAQLLAGFAAAALLLAATGLSGFCSLLVASRTREIGTRMALGARAGQVVTGLFRAAYQTILSGLLSGLALAAATGWLIRSQLFGVGWLDFGTMIEVCLVLGLTCAAALAGPSYRAVRVDPIQAMRQQ